MRIPIAFTALAIAVAVTTGTLGAQEEMPAQARPTPSPTSGICVNKITGAMRDALDERGITQPCHKNEFGVSLQALIALGQATPSPSQTPAPTPTPSGAQNAAIVVDANGTKVGNLFVGAGLSEIGELVTVSINGVLLAIQTGANGFADHVITGGDLVEFYPTQDCSGSGYLILGGGGNLNGAPLNIIPLVQVDSIGNGPYVFNNTVYYAQAPYSNTTFRSFQNFADPTQPSLQGCQGLAPEQYETLMAGQVTSSPLPNFVPPFSVQQ